MTVATLQGRHAVVTGASRGIGAAIVAALAGRGARVTLVGRGREALARLQQSLPGGPHGVAVADVADPARVTAAFEEARSLHGPVSLLVNNAGAAASAPFGRTSLDLWQRMLSVNLTGTFLCTQAVLPDMLAAGWGRIVNIASTAGLKGYAYVSAYAAAKHGVIGMTRSLALEVAARRITVNAVCPGYTDTDLLRASVDHIVARTGRDAEQARAELAAANPQRRLIQPAEVAAAVLWLCGEEAASITGQSISVSGGEVM